MRLYNIGNTHIQAADSRNLKNVAVCNTADFIVPDDCRGAAAVSVVPDFDEKFRKAGAFVLGSSTVPAQLLDLSKMENPHTIGPDRLANAIGLCAGGSLPAVCIDFGTCITFETVDENRCMLGGSILPGRMLLRRSLNDYTARLPLLSLCALPEDVPGNSTEKAINSGCDLGAAGAVRFILDKLKRRFSNLRVVAAGGDAGFFMPFFPEAERLEVSLTLAGLLLAAKYNQ